jgi:hypothetical protein
MREIIVRLDVASNTFTVTCDCGKFRAVVMADRDPYWSSILSEQIRYGISHLYSYHEEGGVKDGNAQAGTPDSGLSSHNPGENVRVESGSELPSMWDDAGNYCGS